MNKHVAALAILTLANLAAAAQAIPGGGAYSASRFSLELDGAMAGYLQSMEGGAVSAPVIEEVSGQDPFTRKQIGAPVFEEFNLRLGNNMHKSIRAWIKSAMEKDAQRKSGSVIASDYNYEEISRYEFRDALLTSVTFPRCDASSNDPGYLSVGLVPEYAHVTKPMGKGAGENSKSNQSRIISGNYQLKIDGLNCSRVMKIESLTVKIPLASGKAGESRDYFQEPGKIEFPNLKVTVSGESYESWRAWHDEFVINGKNSQEHEKTGTLEFLAPDMKTVLLKLEFAGLGIFRLEQQKQAGNTEGMTRYTAELYCEKMVLAP